MSRQTQRGTDPRKVVGVYASASVNVFYVLDER